MLLGSQFGYTCCWGPSLGRWVHAVGGAGDGDPVGGAVSANETTGGRRTTSYTE